jgi:hypothetical protein
MVAGAYQRFRWDSREIVGGPDWFNQARFDVIALAPDGLPRVDADGFPSQLLAMFRRMLEDRFRLVAHWEPRERSIHNLVLDRGDRRLGPKLVPVAVDCAKVNTEIVAGTPPTPRPGRGNECNFSFTSEPGTFAGQCDHDGGAGALPRGRGSRERGCGPDWPLGHVRTSTCCTCPNSPLAVPQQRGSRSTRGFRGGRD